MMHDLAGKEHWDRRRGVAKPRLPSKLNAAVGDFLALLEPHVKPGSRVLEVGCAPGKFLLWCALAKQAQACGVEYAKNNHQATCRLFDAAGVPDADIREEDIMRTTFEPHSFDVVYSFGVIEHFDDPRPVVSKHVEMLKPGGVAIITIPHFGAGSLYGWHARKMKRESYDIHNISIMSERALLKLAPSASDARTYTYGRFSPWLMSWKSSPAPIAKLAVYGLSAIALLQPFQIKKLSPWLVLEIRAPA
jgi:2-polyprenyl-3-methyl-5-hydroxy-6-metoxy-1,4-benzoquinol methylase